MRPVDRRLAIGDIWFLKLPSHTAVERAEILHITVKTILIKCIRKEVNLTDYLARFLIEDIDFIEFIDSGHQSRLTVFNLPKESAP